MGVKRSVATARSGKPPSAWSEHRSCGDPARHHLGGAVVAGKEPAGERQEEGERQVGKADEHRPAVGGASDQKAVPP
jgi:hypothetical protein